MRWLVVRRSAPLAYAPPGSAHAQPPGPGLPRHAPSVNTTAAGDDDTSGGAGVASGNSSADGGRSPDRDRPLPAGPAGRPAAARPDERAEDGRALAPRPAEDDRPLAPRPAEDGRRAGGRSDEDELAGDTAGHPTLPAATTRSCVRAAEPFSGGVQRSLSAEAVPAWTHDHRRVRAPAPRHRPDGDRRVAAVARRRRRRPRQDAGAVPDVQAAGTRPRPAGGHPRHGVHALR